MGKYEPLKPGETLPPMIKPAVKTLPKSRSSESRFQVFNSFVDITMKSLTPAEKDTWMILYRDTKSNGTARTSQADIARRGGKNPRTIRRALDQLVKRGLVYIVYRGGFNRGSSIYVVRGASSRASSEEDR